MSKESENGLDITFSPKFDGTNTASSNDVETSLLVTYEENGITITIVVNTDGSYTIPPGIQDLKVSIETIDDNIDESNETFSLLANITSINKSAEATSIIEDNDTAVKANNDTNTASETGDEHKISEDESKDALSASGNVIGNDSGSNPSFLTSVIFEGASVSIPSDGSNVNITGTHGTLSINSTGVYTYDVNETKTESMNIGDEAHDIFTYTLSDGINADDTATLNITIEGKNDAPTIGSVVVENSSGIVIDGIIDINNDGVSDTLLASELLSKDGGLFFSENNGNLKMDMGTGGTDMSIEYHGGRAGYDNIFGYYELVDGVATNFKVLYIEDGSTKLSGDSLGVLENLEGEIGFFLIPDGQDKSSIMNALNAGESISNIEGTTITFSDNTTANTAVYYTDNNLSTDGRDHAIAGVSADGKGLTIGFEDLPKNNSDQDYDDFVITINYLDSIGNNGQVFTDVNFSDTDNANLASATVTLKNAQDEDSLNIGTLPAGITASILDNNDGTITIIFTGNASLEAYENAIESISFDTNSSNREPRNFELEISDGSKTDTLSKSVNIGSLSLNASSENEVAVLTLNDVSVNEDATSAVYSVSVDLAPSDSPLVITLDQKDANGDFIELIILVGETSVSKTVNVALVKDSDEDSILSIKSALGGSFSSLDLNSSASLNVTAVADLVSVSIDVQDAVYDVPLVETKTYTPNGEVEELEAIVGNVGLSNINGANPSDTFSKEFDFGEEFANQTVTITIDATVSGSWNHGSSATNDTFTVDITGNTSSSKTYMYGQGGSSNVNINENNIYTYDVILDDEGKVTIDLDVSSTEDIEIVTVNSITAVATQAADTITYEVDIEAALRDTDGSETLSVTITNVPTDAKLSEGVINPDGTWTIEVASGETFIDKTITITVASDTNDFVLGITARATETNDNSDKNNYTESSDTSSLKMGVLAITNIIDEEGNYSSVTMTGTGIYIGNTITLLMKIILKLEVRLF